MRAIIFVGLVLFAMTASAQKYETIYTGYVTNGDTVFTSSNAEYPLVNIRAVNNFDTLHLIIQGGDTLAAAGIVYVQTNVFGQWSRGVVLDTISASAGAPVFSYPLDLNTPTNYLVDTLKNRWFFPTGAPANGLGTQGRARALANPSWKYRVFVVGTTGNPTIGGYFKIGRFYW